MMGVNAIVFDLDGTLVEFRMDYTSLRREAVETIESIYGIPTHVISTEISIFGMLEKVSRHLDSVNGSHAIVADLRRQLSSMASKYEIDAAKTTQLITAARNVLREMHSNGFKMGLFTTGAKDAMNHVLQRFDLAKYFDVCVARDDAPKVKPDPSHLNLVLSLLKTPPGQALVVGDTTLDVECAKAAGVRSIGVLTGVHKSDQLRAAGATYILNTLRELPQLVRTINAEPVQARLE